jgi:hypothetical protein
MSSAPWTLEGTWEEIEARAAEFRGKRVRLEVLPATAPELSSQARHGLALLDEWRRDPVTDDEQRVLDEVSEELQQRPFSLRGLRERASS